MRLLLHVMPLAALSACATTIPTTLELARGEHRAACAGWTTRADPCAAPLALFEDRELQRPVARVEHPGSYLVRWSLPDDATDRAEVRLDVDGLALSGWVSLTEREVPLGASTALGPVLRAPAGMPVHVIGRDGTALRVELRTPFRAPALLRVSVPCDALGASASAETTATPDGALVGLRGTLDLAPTPGGAAALRITADESALFHTFEERDGYTHVVANGDGRLAIDAWVPSAAVARDVEPWSDSGCDPSDSTDQAPDATLARSSAVDVGAAPGTPSRLRIAAESPVRVIERREGWVAILPTVSGVGAPEGEQLWVPADALAAP